MCSDKPDPPLDCFVRFKHHVDSHIAAGLSTIFGTSAASSQSPAWAPAPSAAMKSRPNSTVCVDADNDRSHNCREPSQRYREDLSQAPSMDLMTLAYSPYSPTRLRHLPQPKPRDLPSHLDPSVFTFEDAFEDLLAVSQGKPLPDISQKYDQRNFLWRLFPRGEPESYWIERLRSQGLLNRSWRRPSIVQLASPWADVIYMLEGDASRFWTGWKGPQEPRSGHIQQQQQEEEEDYWETQPQSANGPLRRVEDEMSGVSGGKENQISEDQWPPQREPRHYDDLFSAVDRAFTTGQNAWETFINSINEPYRPPRSTEVEKPKNPSETEDKRRVVTRNQWVDVFGLTHEKVQVKTFDDDGNETGTSTTHIVRSTEKKPSEPYGGGDATDENRSEEDESKKPGWFWK